MCACGDECLATVTEGVVHGVYKVVTQSSFGVTRRRKESGIHGRFATVPQGCIQNLRQKLKDRGF